MGCGSSKIKAAKNESYQDDNLTSRSDISQQSQFSTQIPERLRLAAYIELNRDKQMSGSFYTFAKTPLQIDLRALDGMYAYCIVEQINLTQVRKQYLLVAPLIDYQSNHGLFHLHCKRLPDFKETGMQTTIIAGGEIIFDAQNVSFRWNLKSDSFSRRTRFNENLYSKKEDFIALLNETIWLSTDRYDSIPEAEALSLPQFFSGRGSFTLHGRANFWSQKNKAIIQPEPVASSSQTTVISMKVGCII